MSGLPTSGGGGVQDYQVICAWCGSVIRAAAAGAPTTHGICGGCAVSTGIMPVVDVSAMTQETIDRLPFGVICLDATGRITAYNSAEAAIAGTETKHVMGRLFFTEVAPCAKVREFGGEFLRFVADRRSGRVDFLFVFRKDGAETPVRIRLTFDAISRRAVILVEGVA